MRVEPDDYPARWSLTLPDGPAELVWFGTGPWNLVLPGGFGAAEYAEPDDDDEALDELFRLVDLYLAGPERVMVPHGVRRWKAPREAVRLADGTVLGRGWGIRRYPTD